MANLRPQSNIVALTYTKEAAYGTAVADGSITKLYDLMEPTLAEVSQEMTYDEEMIKGHEFPIDTAYNVITSNDVTIPLSFWASPEICGLLFAAALGSISTSGPVSTIYTHTITAMATTTTDQPASLSLVEAVKGETSTYKKYKGVIPNEVKLSCENRGRISVTASCFSDGNIGDASAFSLPSTKETINPLFGKDAVFAISDAGGSPATQATVLRGFEFTWNNNLSREDNRAMINAGVDLTSLRLGAARNCTLTCKIQGSKSSQYFTDWRAKTLKFVKITMASGTKSVIIDINRCLITDVKDSFDGIRNVLEVTFKPYTTTTSTVTPVTITVANLLTGYML